MKGTVLVIDENTETLELLRRIIEKEGFTTVLAKDGEKGLSYAQSDLPEIIVLERLLPVVNGLQVCRRLKEREETRAIPLIFLSVLDTEQDVIEGLRAGADDYVKKPFSPDELVARIERVLERCGTHRKPGRQREHTDE
jgi:DNA-binding response OmpR family regulator